MKVARYYAPEDLRLEDAEVPEHGSGELLLRVRACATCGTDAKAFFEGHRNLKPPRVIGHEIAGEIAAVGDRVGGWRAGDAVQVIAAVPCGSCPECAAGRGNICANLTSIGYDYDGGYAEYVVIPERVLGVDGVNRIPEGTSFAEAALTEPLACVLNGQELAGVGEGDDVVIVGAGPIGCLHARLAWARGAARVILVEASSERLELAGGLIRPDAAVPGGPEAVAAVRALTDGRGADIVIVAAASSAAQEQAVQMAAPRWRISLFASLSPGAPNVKLDANTVHSRELDVVGAANSTPAQNRIALQMIVDGRVPVADLITETLALEGVHDAIMNVRQARGMKYVITP